MGKRRPPHTVRPEHAHTLVHPQTHTRALLPRPGGRGGGRYAVSRPGVPARQVNSAAPRPLRTLTGAREESGAPGRGPGARGRPTRGASGRRRRAVGAPQSPARPLSPQPKFAPLAPPSRPPPFLTQILPQVEQEARGSPAELIEEGAQAEDQQGGHAETVVPEGEAQERQQGDPALPAAQARRGAPQSRPMGPGIRAAAGMPLLLHRLLRRLAQPARARERSPIRLRGERGRPAAHGQGRAEGQPGWGRGGSQLLGSGHFPRHGPRRCGPSGRGVRPRLGGAARARRPAR